MTSDPPSNPNKQPWTIEFSFENSDEKLRVYVETEYILGRRDPSHHDEAFLDLLPFGGAEKGVSRHHAALRWQNGSLCIVDLNSANGTYLNSQRLESGMGYRVADGDTLHVGHLPIKLHLNDLFGETTVQARRIDLDNRYVPAAGRGQKILIVEDDPGLSELYRIAVERAGFTVHITRDVISAMKTLHQFTPALIVLDLMLPGVQGLELARYIRRDSDGPVIPIIVLSALNDTATIAAAMEDGVDVYMTKPPNLKEMVHIVSQVIDRTERNNPSLHTKKLKTPEQIEEISAAPRNDTIVLFVENRREPIAAVVTPQLTLGRKLPSAQSRNHIDLDDMRAFDKGVSRIHARIRRTAEGFAIADQKSSNGTFINGHKLDPEQEYVIHNGDEVRLGEMKIRFYMLGSTDKLEPLGVGTAPLERNLG